MTNSYEQVEKVARAICRATCAYDICECNGWYHESLTLAHAAIAALGITDTAPAPAISGGEMAEALEQIASKANLAARMCSTEGPADGFRHLEKIALAALAAADRSAAAPTPDMVSVPKGRWCECLKRHVVACNCPCAAAPAPQQGEKL